MTACCPFIPARMGTALTEAGEPAGSLWMGLESCRDSPGEWERWESLCLVKTFSRAWLKGGERGGELVLGSTHPNWTSDWNNFSNESSSGTSSTNNSPDFTCVWLTSAWGWRDRDILLSDHLRWGFLHCWQQQSPASISSARSWKEHPKRRRLTWRIISFIF